MKSEIQVHMSAYVLFSCLKQNVQHSNIKSDAQTSAPPSSKATGKVSSHKHLWGSRLFCLQQPDRAASLPRLLLRICQVMSQSSSAFIPGRKTWEQARISSQMVAISTQFLHLLALPLSCSPQEAHQQRLWGYYTNTVDLSEPSWVTLASDLQCLRSGKRGTNEPL